MIDLIFASLIQGITEFIPVSSSLHLLIYENFFSNKELSLVIISSMHMGSILALILFTFFDTKSHLSIFSTQTAPNQVKVPMKRLTPPPEAAQGGARFLRYLLIYVPYDPNFFTNVNYKVEDTFQIPISCL